MGAKMCHIYGFFHQLLEVSGGLYKVPLNAHMGEHVNVNVECGFPSSLTGNLRVVEGEALLARSSFWKEPHACTMEKVSVLLLSS